METNQQTKMKIDELMRQIVLELGFPADAAEQAQRFVDSVHQGADIKRMIDRDLTQEQIDLYRMYVLTTIARALTDPEFKEEFMKEGEKHFGKN